MYITLKTDYAIRIMDTLAQADGRLNAQSISNKSNVTLRFALKILTKLVKSGLVKSYKGAQGGYEINKDPSEISLNDILEVIEGPYKFSRCLDEEHVCMRRGVGNSSCKYHLFFDDISHQMKARLAEATIDQFIAK